MWKRVLDHPFWTLSNWDKFLSDHIKLIYNWKPFLCDQTFTLWISVLATRRHKSSWSVVVERSEAFKNGFHCRSCVFLLTGIYEKVVGQSFIYSLRSSPRLAQWSKCCLFTVLSGLRVGGRVPPPRHFWQGNFCWPTGKREAKKKGKWRRKRRKEGKSQKGRWKIENGRREIKLQNEERRFFFLLLFTFQNH